MTGPSRSLEGRRPRVGLAQPIRALVNNVLTVPTAENSRHAFHHLAFHGRIRRLIGLGPHSGWGRVAVGGRSRAGLRQRLGALRLRDGLYGGASFLRPVRSGDLVEVEARLAYTGSSSMSMAVEVRAGSIQDRDLQPVTHCVVVYAAVDDDGQPRAVDAWTPETPGDIALAQRVKAHIDAARAAQ